MNGQSRNALKRARAKAQEMRKEEKGKRQAFVLVRLAELMLEEKLPHKAAKQQARKEYDLEQRRQPNRQMWPAFYEN